MKTIALYLSVISVAAIAAWAVFSGAKDDEATTEQNDPESIEGTSLDPLWYRNISREERLGSARFRLLRMSSTVIAANQAGPVKDEIALLCHDEAVVDQIITAFEETPPRAPARISAFMEIFARVRHPRFAELFIRAVNHEEYEPKANALEAARVQATPEALPLLATALADADADEQVRVVRAIQAIGSPEGYDLIRRQLGRLERNALIIGLPILAESNYREARPGIERLMDHEDVDVAIIAAYAAARLGKSSAIARLREHARNLNRLDGSRAQAVQLHARIAPRKEADAFDRELLDDPVSVVRAEALAGLVARRDAAALASAAKALGSKEPYERSEAMIALARSGRDEDLDVIRPFVVNSPARELKLLFSAMGFGRAPGSVDFMAEFMDRGLDIRRNVLYALPSHGQRAVPLLTKCLQEAEEETAIGDLARALSSIPCPASREALLAWVKNPRGSKRLRTYVRSGVQRIDQDLIAGKLAPLDRGLE